MKTPLDYIRELIWDNTMAHDRFFGWADPAVIEQVLQAVAQGQFAPEVGTGFFHPGATRSWRQMQLGEANVQLTFHENNTKTINGMQCVMIEPDIDYYKDLAAHALLEVITNRLKNSLSDPRQVSSCGGLQASMRVYRISSRLTPSSSLCDDDYEEGPC